MITLSESNPTKFVIIRDRQIVKKNMIPQTEYRERREQVMAKIGNGTAIIKSAPVAVMHNDVEYAYRQDSDFFYLTGFNEPLYSVCSTQRLGEGSLVGLSDGCRCG
jgi:Xaa-Pro aminopeptidase